jgi:hypothetical protein
MFNDKIGVGDVEFLDSVTRYLNTNVATPAAILKTKFNYTLTKETFYTLYFSGILGSLQ